MNTMVRKSGGMVILVMTMLLFAFPRSSSAIIYGNSGTTFNLTAKDGWISTGDGDSVYMWGYTLGNNPMQYPGPTIIVNQGDVVTVQLTNTLPFPVSIVFPGQTVTALGGTAGLLTREAHSGSPAVQYQFTASNPGTYMYYSGTRSDLQVEMGLVGAIIVRPTGYDPGNTATWTAYGDPSTQYDREYLFLLSEIDPGLHLQVYFGGAGSADMSARHPVTWFINGRNLPDTMAQPFAPWLPSQPYNCMPMGYPGEKILIRMIGGGLDLHPFHTHGQNHLVIARDGRLLKSLPSASADLAVSDYTTTSLPGETVDAIWGPWTGYKLGWDIYGDPNNPDTAHTCTPDGTGFDPTSHEWCADHGKPVPVQLPAQSDLTFGPFYGGTPFLGVPGAFPPSHTDYNPQGGLAYFWHSHNERELTTNNIFVGGMGTMFFVMPIGTPIP